jgi:hypothetical protein
MKSGNSKTHIKGKKQLAEEFTRAELVGKFPHIKHQPAPKAKFLLSEEVRYEIVARMKLRQSHL